MKICMVLQNDLIPYKSFKEKENPKSSFLGQLLKNLKSIELYSANSYFRAFVAVGAVWFNKSLIKSKKNIPSLKSLQ